MAYLRECGICKEEVWDDLVCRKCALAAGELVILGQKPTKEMVLHRVKEGGVSEVRGISSNTVASGD